METQGIISKLDNDTVLQWLNSYIEVKMPNSWLNISINTNRTILHQICRFKMFNYVKHYVVEAKFFGMYYLSESSKLLTTMLLLSAYTCLTFYPWVLFQGFI